MSNVDAIIIIGVRTSKQIFFLLLPKAEYNTTF